MKVRELIDLLEMLPKEMDVVYPVEEDTWYDVVEPVMEDGFVVLLGELR